MLVASHLDRPPPQPDLRRLRQTLGCIFGEMVGAEGGRVGGLCALLSLCGY